MAAAGDRLRMSLDTINKMPARQIEWFFLLQMRNVAVSVMIGIMKFGEAVVVGRSYDSNIVNAEFLVRL